MDEASQALRQALVDVFLPYVHHRMEQFGVDGEAHSRALGDARRALGEALEELLTVPYDLQERGPLELFQEAMSAPTAILRQLGKEPADRDEVARSALPGDLFDLAPVSSRALGDEVWAAHLTWGATKAAAIRGDAAT